MPQLSAYSSIEPDPTPDLELIPSLKVRAGRASTLDAVAWKAGLSFTAYGVRVGIRSNRAHMLEQCLASLPVGWRPSSSPAVDRLYSIVCESEPGPEGCGCCQLYRDNRPLLRDTNHNELMERLESEIALHVADTTPRRVFVHAGVVGLYGRAIVIPGRSWAGKTTLTAALVHAGATYYSDEFAVIDSRGLVHPYPRPLQIRKDGEQTKHSAQELGAITGHVPLPVGLVLLSRYKSGARWRPRPISQGQALLGMLDNTVSARRAPAVALKTLKEALSSSFMVKGVRGDAEEVVRWIEKHFHPKETFSTLRR